jgi:hypothetical protein
MADTINLGIIKAIHVGATAPSNTVMLWYNTGDDLHYYYNLDTTTWEKLYTPAFTMLIEILYDDLRTAMTGGTLTKGAYYKITDYYTKWEHNITGAVTTGVNEPLVVLAISDTQVSNVAYSTLHQDDIILYDVYNDDISGNPRTGMITYRKMVSQNLSADFDFRYIVMQRKNITGTAWVSLGSYSAGNVREYAGSLYVCVLTHSGESGAPDVDIERWRWTGHADGDMVVATDDESDIGGHGTWAASNVGVTTEDYVTFADSDTPTDISALMYNMHVSRYNDGGTLEEYPNVVITTFFDKFAGNVLDALEIINCRNVTLAHNNVEKSSLIGCENISMYNETGYGLRQSEIKGCEEIHIIQMHLSSAKEGSNATYDMIESDFTEVWNGVILQAEKTTMRHCGNAYFQIAESCIIQEFSGYQNVMRAVQFLQHDEIVNFNNHSSNEITDLIIRTSLQTPIDVTAATEIFVDKSKDIINIGTANIKLRYTDEYGDVVVGLTD